MHSRREWNEGRDGQNTDETQSVDAEHADVLCVCSDNNRRETTLHSASAFGIFRHVFCRVVCALMGSRTVIRIYQQIADLCTAFMRICLSLSMCGAGLP